MDGVALAIAGTIPTSQWFLRQVTTLGKLFSHNEL